MIIDVHTHIGLSQDGGYGQLDELIVNMGKIQASHFIEDAHDMGNNITNGLFDFCGNKNWL